MRAYSFADDANPAPHLPTSQMAALLKGRRIVTVVKLFSLRAISQNLQTLPGRYRNHLSWM